jgi:hypothetical protein
LIMQQRVPHRGGIPGVIADREFVLTINSTGTVLVEDVDAEPPCGVSARVRRRLARACERELARMYPEAPKAGS